jgi:hypothetical protein
MVPFGGAPEVIVSVAGAVVAMELEFPVREGLTESVAVMVWLPEVSSVPEKFPAPFVIDELEGGTKLGSLLVKWTVPE